MARIHRRFSRAFFVTVATALAILASVPFWGVVNDQWQAWGCFRRLHDPTLGVRREAAEDLARLGPAASAWVVRAVGDADPKVRVVACSILPRTDPDHPALALDALANALKDGDATVRWAAANQLGLAAVFLATRAGAEATDRAVGALREAIRDEAKDVRGAAIYALEALGKSAKSAIPDLDRALVEAEPTFRVFAAEALLKIDPVGTRPRVIPALQALLANPSALWEEDRMVRLLKTELGEEGVAAALIPLLQHEAGAVRQGALAYLDSNCSGAKGTKPAFVAALTNADWMVRGNAALLVLKHEPTLAGLALDTLVDQLVNWHDGGWGPEDIIKDLREGFPESLGPVAILLVAALDRAATPDQRRNAIYALALVGTPGAETAIPALRRAALSDDRTVQLRAVEALARIDPPSAAAFLPVLFAWCRPGEDVAIRLSAMTTLGKIGPAANSAVPVLLRFADEDDIRVSTAAIEALTRIDFARAAELKRSIRAGH